MTTDHVASAAPDQLTFTDPVRRYPRISPPEQHQEEPGLDAALLPRADLGERTYRGTGRLVGRKALVTGGDSGIGAAAAIAFAREGADVAITYLPAEEEDAQHVAAVIRDSGRTAVTLPGDLVDPAFCVEAVDRAAAELGGLDILVNNAAKQLYAKTLEELPDDQLEETFQANVLAMFRTTRAALKHLPPGSTVIITSSTQAYVPNPILLDYASTKAAVNNLAKGLAQQLVERGIRVNAVAPGPVWTPLQPSGGKPTDVLQEFGHDSALGRAAQPTEMAPAFVFLASPESSFVVGETLNVNGGAPTP